MCGGTAILVRGTDSRNAESGGVSARWCVTAAVSLISRKGIFLVLAHRTRLCVQTLAPRVI